jgi:hypothetical protein
MPLTDPNQSRPFQLPTRGPDEAGADTPDEAVVAYDVDLSRSYRSKARPCFVKCTAERRSTRRC